MDIAGSVAGSAAYRGSVKVLCGGIEIYIVKYLLRAFRVKFGYAVYYIYR